MKRLTRDVIGCLILGLLIGTVVKGVLGVLELPIVHVLPDGSACEEHKPDKYEVLYVPRCD